MTSPYVFDVAAFRLQFPQFASVIQFPNVTLQMYYDQATCYISDQNYGWLNGNCRFLALNLMTAHLAALSLKVNAGKVTGLVQTSTIDKISVGLTPPPLKSQWQWWMNLTSYGQQLFAMLQAKAVGGLYVGGLPERNAIRKVY